MGEQLIENPVGAYSPLVPIEEFGQAPSSTYRICKNTGATAILANQWVAVDITGTAAHIFGIVQGLHGLTIAQCIGIADDAIPVNGFGRIIVDGPAVAIAGAAGVTLGSGVSPSTVATDDGQLVNASAPTVGQVIGLALQTGAAHGTFAIWVTKS